MKKYDINESCIDLLELIYIRQFNITAMSVTEIMEINQCGSPATIHRKLSRLRDANLLIFLYRETDKRTKYPSLTKDAIEYFNNFSKEIMKIYI
jgi:hypothetical protein